MLRWHLKELIGKYESVSGDSISYRLISEKTGIAVSSIADIATGKATRADLRTLDALLGYFSGLLGEDITAGDLLQRSDDAPTPTPTPITLDAIERLRQAKRDALIPKEPTP